jgi:hypothetical protein
MVGSKPCPQILIRLGCNQMAVENTLAYYNTAAITAIKSFIVEARFPNFWPDFSF